jgi:flagellar basal body-associated protein FliL
MNKILSLKESFKEAAHSRVFIALWAVIVLQVCAMIGLVFVMGRIGQPGTPVRYDGFSATNISLDNGLYLTVFAIWAVIFAILNIVISLKTYGFRGRQVALIILWLTVSILLIATVFAVALLSAGSAY